MYKRDIYLDIDDKLNEHIKSVELDSNSRVWHFHLTVDYEPLDLTGKSVRFRAEKPDKTNVLNDCKIVDAEKGVVEVKLTRQVNAIPGHVKCLLKIIGDEGFVLKTKTFVVDVSKTLSDDAIVSSDEFGALEAALGKVQDIDNRFAQTNAQLSGIENKFNYIKISDYAEFITHGDWSVAINRAISDMKQTGIAKLFFPRGEYTIKNNITLTSGEYFGEIGTILIIEGFSGESCINNEYGAFDASGNTNEIIIRNIEFKLSKVRNDFATNNFLLRLTNCQNSLIEMCKFYSDAESTVGYSAIDLYTNNKNISIKNCKFVQLGTNQRRLTTPLLIREYRSTCTTEDIFVKDSSFEKDGIDEVLWVDAWNGTVKNVDIDNVILIDKGEAENMIWFGANNSNSHISNCRLTNSRIIKEKLSYRVFAIGDCQNVSSTGATTANIVIDNNYIEVKSKPSESDYGYLFFGGKTFVNDDSIVISNNTIKAETTLSPLTYLFSGGFITKNNLINTNAKTSYLKVKRCYGDHVKTTSILSRSSEYFENCNIICSKAIDNYQNSTASIVFKNCVVETTDAFCIDSNSVVDSTFELINCKIKNTDILFNIWQPSSVINVELLNTDIANRRLTNNNSTKIKISGLSLNREPYRGLPENNYDKNALIVGTILPSNQPGKILHRKISEGNSDENWETL